MEERERGLCFAKKRKRGLCCVKMKKNGGVYIVRGEGVVRLFRVGLGGKEILNFEGRWSL